MEEVPDGSLYGCGLGMLCFRPDVLLLRYP